MSAPSDGPRPYIVGAIERGKLAVVGRYRTEGEGKRAMRGIGATGHVVLEGSLLACHPGTPESLEKLIARALRDDTHPALAALDEPAAPAPARPAPIPAPVVPAPELVPAPVPAPEDPAPTELTTMSLDDQADEEDREEQQEEDAQRAADRELVGRAVSAAGGPKPLSEAIECHSSVIYSVRSGSKPMSPAMRARIEAYLAEPVLALAPAERPVTVEAPQPKPVVTRRPPPVVEAPAPVASSSPSRTVRIALDQSTARDLYQIARTAGLDALALQVGDALIDAA